MTGKLIVCEGLDCSGKTTAIQQILFTDPRYVYSKGIGANSRMGRWARRHPSTLMFLTELLYHVYTEIKPALDQDQIVLQDRYDISLSSYLPSVNERYNKLLLSLARPFLPEPDGIVYFTLPLEERIARLKQKGQKYELLLAEHPALITLRETAYERWYQQFTGPKLKIDTAQNNITETAQILSDFIAGLTNQRNL